MGVNKKVEPKDISVTISIPLHVYPWDVVFSFNTTDDQLEKELIKKSGFEPSDFNNGLHRMNDTCGARWTYYPQHLCTVIRMRNIPETSKHYSYLSHEIFHAVAKIMEEVGLSLQVGVSDEAYAYLVSYLTNQIYERLNKYY